MPAKNYTISFYNQSSINNLSAGEKAQIIFLDQLLDDQKWSPKIWQETWEDFNFFILQVVIWENQICGFALWTLPPRDIVAHLLKIVVGLPWRSKGLAAILMESFSLDFPAKGIYLEVKTSNIAAVKFYEKFGLKIITKSKNYYGQGHDAYKMLRPALPSSTLPDIP